MALSPKKIPTPPFRPSRDLLLRMGLARTKSAPGLDCFGVLSDDDESYFDWTVSINHATHEVRVRTWNHGVNEGTSGYWEQVYRGTVDSAEEFTTALKQVGWPL